jgi:hypothetical protein
MDHGLRGRAVTAAVLDFSFPRAWRAEILARRPLILPPHHYVYPREAEEVERGALEVLIHPVGPQPDEPRPADRPFLATCALGFRDPVAPTGLWSTPEPEKICAVSGGYAYIIDTTAPERFTMIPYRPVLAVQSAIAANLLLFVGHHSILAWGKNGQAWESGKLSDEGVTITSIENGLLHGRGWDLMSDMETPFALNLHTGERLPSDAHF